MGIAVLARIWVALAAVVLLLAGYRWFLTRGDYTLLHVRRSEVALIPQQLILSRRLSSIDLWGRLLTTIALVFGLILTGLYLRFVVLAQPGS